MPMSDPSNESNDLPFEEALAQLEAIVHDLEEGDTGLDESLSRYEQGIALIKQCHARLRQAEQQILLLTEVDDQGQPVLQPFQHEATASRKVDYVRRRPPKQDSDELPF